MTARIDTEKQINGTAPGGFFERLIQTLVSRVSGAPDLILERFVNVIFRVRLDHKVSGLTIR